MIQLPDTQNDPFQLVIRTHSHSPLSSEFWKWLARRTVRKTRGPNAVCDSLIRALRNARINFSVDTARQKASACIVLSGPVALQEAIQDKQRGRFHKLIAGPNILTTPDVHNGLIRNSAIDVILVPSEWVKDLWLHLDPSLKSRLHVWPSGTQTYAPSSRDGAAVVYNKLADPTVLATVQETLKRLNYHVKIFTYGAFSQSDYFTALETAPLLVYLGGSESQGLALQEAWAHDVPTLVKQVTDVTANSFTWHDRRLAAPYLTDELGFFFNTASELPELTKKATALMPKTYTDANLSDTASLNMLLSLL